jgi:hypothetical protein
MSRHLNYNLRRTTTRKLGRELACQAGPEAGRHADHLKRRATSAATERLLRRAEADPAGLAAAADLTARVGETAVALLFLYGLSVYGGPDVYGG